MQEIFTRSWMAGALLVAAMATATQFEAPSPGALLEPVGNAASVIRISQGQQTVLWNSGIPVSTYRVEGWPSSDGVHELGGAVIVEAVDASEGIVAFGERPRRLDFSH